MFRCVVAFVVLSARQSFTVAVSSPSGAVLAVVDAATTPMPEGPACTWALQDCAALGGVCVDDATNDALSMSACACCG